MIRAIRLSNYGPFRGDHLVKLDAKAYSVHARSSEDPERSNWLGKTVLLGAARHALNGQHAWRTEDAWVTRGEEEGSVGVDVVQGNRTLSVLRTRRRGKSTLIAEVDGVAIESAKAQATIDEFIGLDKADFDSAAFISPADASSFVTARPAARMAMVRGWLELDRLTAALDNAKSHMRGALSSAQANRSQLEAVRKVLGEAAAEEDRATVAAAKEAAGEALARAEAELERLRKASSYYELRLEYEKIVERGKAARAAKDALPAAREESAATRVAAVDAKAKLAKASAELQEARRLHAGDFDGTCPVSSQDCPAAAEVRAACKGNDRRLSLAREAHKEADEAAEGPVRLMEDAFDRASRLASKADEVEGLRERARELAPHKSAEPVTEEALEQAKQARLQARSAASDAASRLAVVESSIASTAAWKRSEATLAKDVEEAEANMAALRHVCVALKQAERSLAEGVLGAIAASTNGALLSAGIDLAVGVRWQRDGGDLADRCDACDSAYPRTQKVKQCARCGAERGFKQLDGLELDLSSRSGAADDLAGILFRLAAGAWLRGVRGCAWSSIFLDEPLAACDRANRRAFGTWLAARSKDWFGLDQAFVISHSPDSDVFEGRINIISEGGASRVEVT